MLYLHQSNRLETLAARLGEVIREPGPDVLAPEVLVVPNAGVGRWLSLALARQLGVSANLRLRFPAEFVWDVARAILPDVPPRSAFDRELLGWRVFEALGERPDERAFGPIEAYLSGDDDLMRYELAQQIAHVFDQYLVYRPDLIRAWEAGEGTHWQAALWRRLAREGGDRHWARLQEDLIRALERGVPAAPLPHRVALFALSALSPGYLAIVAALAQHTAVHLYLLNPCREYWGDVVSERRLAAAAAGDTDALAYAEAGNPLLASLGQQGRDFIDMVGECGPVEEDLYVEPPADRMLGRVQADILDLLNRGTAAADGTLAAPAAAIGERRSLQVHACHSPMREVEVLHDQLLALIEERRAHPADIVVMTPDIETYAPYIEAVFAAAPAPRNIPFSVADRALATESPVVAGFFALLALADSRYDANAVLALLETEAVGRRFGLAEADVPLVRRWVRESGIRWGVDAEGRERLGLPPFAQNSWEHGLDRLTLGYALPAAGAALFADILPYDDIEGSRAQTLGRLRGFAERLFRYGEELRRQRPLADWARILSQGLDLFFAPGEAEEEDAQAIRRALAALEQAAGVSKLAQAVSLDVVRAHLETAIAPPRPSGRFLAGGVTFCALVPMRSLPFKVVCLIGMNDGSFPRVQAPPGFDLIARDFRRGDRSRRADDRYLFLETLLAARDVLYVSYVGQGIRDNAALPPSVLVSELLDYLRQAFVPADGGDIVEELSVRHPLQPFSTRYFASDGRLFSYADDLARASAIAAGGRREPPLLLEQRLPPPEDEWRTVTAQRLTRFFRNPVRYLLKERLGVVLEEAEGLIEDREPFDLERPVAWDIRTALIEAEIAGEPLEQVAAALRAGGQLPVGEAGGALLSEQRDTARAIARRVRELCDDAGRAPVGLDLALGDWHIGGQLGGLWACGRVHYQSRELTAADLLEAWILHLCLNAVRPDAVDPQSWIIGRGREVVFSPVADAAAHLGRLLALYWEGLHRPLHFFPKSADAYVSDADEPLAAARKVWQHEQGWPEGANEYYRCAFRDSDPLDAEFERLAGDILGPLHAHAGERR